MKAIAITPGTPGAHFVERPEPAITAPGEVKMRILRVGICGTDREEIAGGRAAAPPGQKELVIGHEMLGRVVAIGSAVSRVAVGDYAVFTVRRGCGACLPCRIERADMCETGNYRERGIQQQDGYQTEFAVDEEQYVVRIPPALAPVAVLMEPLSIVEKALDEVLKVQIARSPTAATTPDWLFGRRCLVAGLGPVGLLGAMVLRLRGAEVYGLDIVDQSSARPAWLEHIGGHYVDGRRIPAPEVGKKIGAMALILDASGVPALEFNLLDALARNGAYVLTGIPGGDRPLQIPGAALIQQLVLDNQVMLGSVNAARGHFQIGAADLTLARDRWGQHLEGLITQHLTPEEFLRPGSKLPPDAIKQVVAWAPDAPESEVSHDRV